MTFWAYMLHCNGGFLYVGHTGDLERRIAQHESGCFPGFVRDHWPARLIWSQEFPTRLEALECERRLKGWSKAKKLALVRGDFALIASLARKKDSASTGSARTWLGDQPDGFADPTQHQRSWGHSRDHRP